MKEEKLQVILTLVFTIFITIFFVFSFLVTKEEYIIRFHLKSTGVQDISVFKEYVPYFEFNLPLFMKKEYTNLILTFKVFDLNNCSRSYPMECRLLVNKTVESVDIRKGYYDFPISKELVAGKKLLVEAQLFKIKENGSINPLGNILKKSFIIGD